MAIQLRKKLYKNGTTGLYLDIYHNGKRTYEFLKECYLVTKPRNQVDRETNKEREAVAKAIKSKRELQIANEEYGFDDKSKRKGSFIAYFQVYVNNYVKKDRRKSASALRALKEHLQNKDISFSQINDKFLVDFKTYLEANSDLSGETPSIYLTQLKRVVKMAYKEGIIKKYYGEDVRIPKTTEIRKDILTGEELALLSKAYCGNEDVKRAFLFSCNTGLRMIDIKSLTWKQVKQGEGGQMLNLNQSKTGKPVKVALNGSALKYLGSPLPSNELIFNLPSHTAVTKLLKNWAKKAGVDKTITYHVARHTFGTLLAHNNTNLKDISSLMGHTSLAYTNLYVRESEAQKRTAVNSLPEF